MLYPIRAIRPPSEEELRRKQAQPMSTARKIAWIIVTAIVAIVLLYVITKR